MKQVFQNLKTGVVSVEDVPTSGVRPGHVLIQTRRSLISAGTERMLVEFGRASLLAKARQQPERVKQAIDKIKSDGLLPTLEAIFSRLDEPLPLGYCNAGVVVSVGDGVTEFQSEDRVASTGPHAEMVLVPRNLCASIPDPVADEEAAFAALGAIGLQGIRLLQPEMGERFVVTGLGLVGLLAAQLLAASGCHVLGLDRDAARVELAKRLGMQALDVSRGDALSAANSFSLGRGVDGVLVAASTKSSQPIHQAALMCRKRGRIVLVGVTGLEISRADFYEKELTFQVSCAYGPGRYDPAYEEQGADYPFGFVRWTSQRNLQAVLEAMQQGRLQVTPLITHRVAIENARRAYELITDDRSALGVILEYGSEAAPLRRTVSLPPRAAPRASAPTPTVVAGIIGAGLFTKATLLPSLKGAPVRLRTIASAGGASAQHLGKKFGFAQVTSDFREVLSDPAINLVFVATRHNQHARMVIEALRSGKHVFVEKPICLTADELKQVKLAYEEAAASGAPRQIMVGFNRRFAPHVVKMKDLLSQRTEPVAMTMMVNAGPLPADHWLLNPTVGGGRLIGEGCHFVDLLRHVAGSAIVSVTASALDATGTGGAAGETSVVTLGFADGSMGTLQYLSNGDRSFPRERLEVFCGGRVLALDNFRSMRGYGWPAFRRLRLGRQDLGHRAQFLAVVERVAEGGPPLIPFEEIEDVQLACVEAAEQVGAVTPKPAGS